MLSLSKHGHAIIGDVARPSFDRLRMTRKPQDDTVAAQDDTVAAQDDTVAAQDDTVASG
jgi:hypothetical protein